MKNAPQKKIKELLAEYKMQIENIARERDKFLHGDEKISKNEEITKVRKVLKRL
jgi:hypothetical protein